MKEIYEHVFQSINYEDNIIICRIDDTVNVVFVPQYGTIIAKLMTNQLSAFDYKTAIPLDSARAVNLTNDGIIRSPYSPIYTSLEYQIWSNNLSWYCIEWQVKSSFKIILPQYKMSKKEVKKITRYLYSYYRKKVDKYETEEKLIDMIKTELFSDPKATEKFKQQISSIASFN